jgi:predicted DNA-binding transcriptional regulator AlpA
MSPRVPPDQVSSYPGGSCASSDGRRLDDRDLILRRRRGTRYGDTPADDSDDCFLTAVQVRQRYGNASDMWLWRLLRDDSNFPRPIEIRKRRYWKLSDLIAWERACARTSRLPPPKSAKPATEGIGQPASKSKRLSGAPEPEANNSEPIKNEPAQARRRREVGS